MSIFITFKTVLYKVKIYVSCFILTTFRTSLLYQSTLSVLVSIRAHLQTVLPLSIIIPLNLFHIYLKFIFLLKLYLILSPQLAKSFLPLWLSNNYSLLILPFPLPSTHLFTYASTTSSLYKAIIYYMSYLPSAFYIIHIS